MLSSRNRGVWYSEMARRTWIQAAVLVLAVVALFVTPRAEAQALPFLPDPIMTRDLMEYADIIGLTPQQRLSLEPAHDDYLRRFRRLRDGDIQEFQDRLMNIAMRFMGGQIVIPEREELEDIIDTFEDLLGKIESVDKSLFDAIQPMVTEAQLPRLQQARTARILYIHRMIVLEMAGEFNEGCRPNLSEMARGIELTTEEEAHVALILPTYESSLLAEVRRIHDVLRAAAKVALDVIDQIGLRGMTPEQMMQLEGDIDLQQTLRDTFNEASKPYQAAAHDISQLNMKTYRRLVAGLSPESARELRDRYYRRAYRRAYRGPLPFEERYRKALELDDVADSLKPEIRTQRDQYRRQDEVIVDALVNDLESSRKYRTMEQLEREVEDPVDKKMEDGRERRKTLSDAAIRTLDGLLGPDIVAILDEKPGNEHAEHTHSGTMVVSNGRSDTRAVSVARAEVRDQFQIETPDALPREIVDIGARLLEVDDFEREMLTTLFDDYRTTYDEAVQTLAAQVEAINAAKNGEDGSEAPATTDEPTDESVSASFLALEDQFFNDLVAITSGDDDQSIIERLRRARHRQLASDLSRQATWVFGDEEAFLDLAWVLYEVSDLIPMSLVPNELLAAYESELGSLSEDRLERARECRKRRTMMTTVQEKGGSPELMQKMMEKWQEARSSLASTNRSIRTLNRDYLEQLYGAMDSDRQWQLRYQYNVRAYPDIFSESEQFETMLGKVRKLPGLSGDQLERITDVGTAFRETFFALSDRMVDLRRLRDFDPSSFRMPDRDMIEREIELERISFERDEAMQRARMKLRLALTEAQLQYVPELTR